VRSPLLGEHTDEILEKVLKLDKDRVAKIKASGATGQKVAQAAE
jgi:formyl-CoA transferase